MAGRRRRYPVGDGSALSLSPEQLASLLERTSRTFALAIPLLAEPLRAEVGAAYLVFRIADTLEDATLWGRDGRLTALRSLAAWLEREGEGEGATAWREAVRRSPPTADAACLELLARADAVRATVASFAAVARDAVLAHARRTALGMAEFVARQDEHGAIALHDIEDLRAYCYVVAGIVGEMLTELFVNAAPSLANVRSELTARAAAFGEGLQLVNILKDGASDAKEGRVYVPLDVPRADVVRLARADLDRATEYVALLARGGAPDPIRAFAELPVRLAVATLDRLDEGGTKLARDEVRAIHAEVTARTR